MIWIFRNSLDKILAKSGRRRVFEDVADWIERRKEPELFSPEERLIWSIKWLTHEVSNGGLDQYLFNATGNVHHELINSLERINAVNSATILRAVSSMFPNGCVPSDLQERRALMIQIREQDEADYWRRIEELTGRFYENLPEIWESALRFVREHRNLFS